MHTYSEWLHSRKCVYTHARCFIVSNISIFFEWWAMQYWRKMSSYGLHEIIISNETPSVWFTSGHSMDFMNDRVNLLLLFCFRKVVGCGWQISLTPDAPNWWLPWHKYVMHRSVKFLFFSLHLNIGQRIGLSTNIWRKKWPVRNQDQIEHLFAWPGAVKSVF